MPEETPPNEQAPVPYTFHISEAAVAQVDKLNAEACILQQLGTGLHTLYDQNAEHYLHRENGRPEDASQYRLGFGVAAAAIERSLAEGGISFPVISGDIDSIVYYQRRMNVWHEDSAEEKVLKDFLANEERSALERLDNIYPDTSVALIDGFADAYVVLSEAVHNRLSAPGHDDPELPPAPLA